MSTSKLCVEVCVIQQKKKHDLFKRRHKNVCGSIFAENSICKPFKWVFLFSSTGVYISPVSVYWSVL